MQGRTAAPYIMHNFYKKSDFGVAGNVKFLQKQILYSWTQNSPIWTRELASAFKSRWYMERLLIYNQICDEKLPLVKIRKKQPKSEIS